MSSSLILGMVMAVSAALLSAPLTDGQEIATAPVVKDYPYLVPGDDSLLASNEFSSKRSVVVPVTGYSSEECQTDDTPFITASGNTVRSGIVAANWLPLGTKVRIPELFGNRVFVVDDRMHPKNDGKLDIWFQTREEALKFGVTKARVEVL
ncbi:MAG: hypothetical protein PHP35_02020 [Candidatus Colwellbacteria bacterium]|nr:hypothetical protein [Candidatus Colwellbacteria bacterium]